MAYRRKMSKRASKINFRKNAMKHHKKNKPRVISRGGIRL